MLCTGFWSMRQTFRDNKSAGWYPVEYAGIIFNGSFIPRVSTRSRFFHQRRLPSPPIPDSSMIYRTRKITRAYTCVYTCIHIYTYISYNNVIVDTNARPYVEKFYPPILYVYIFGGGRNITKIIPHVTHCPPIILFPSNRWSLFCHCFSIVGRANDGDEWRRSGARHKLSLGGERYDACAEFRTRTSMERERETRSS